MGKISAMPAVTAASTPETAYVPLVNPEEANPNQRNKRIPVPELRKLVGGGNPEFTALEGTVWDGTNKKKVLTANTALTLAQPLTSLIGLLDIEMGGSGGYTLSINGTPITINSSVGSVTSLGLYHQGVYPRVFVDLNPVTPGSSAPPSNTTPTPPTVNADDTADTLLFTHALGNSEIEVSVNNGAYGAQPSGGYNIGDVNLAAAYYRARIKAATGRNASSIVSSPAFTQQVVGNTTPAAPSVSANDAANTLSFSHALGNSEILVSENNGAYAAYTGTITVGDVVRAAGYWKAKIKSAAGRNESAVTSSPAFTSAPVGYHAKSSAFFTATGITDAGLKDRINNAVVAMENAGLLTGNKLVKWAPNVGPDENARSLNLFDVNQFETVFYPGITHNSAGSVGNGVSGGGVADLGLSIGVDVDPAEGWGWAIFRKNPSQAGFLFDIGVDDPSSGGNHSMIGDYDGTISVAYFGVDAGGTVISSTPTTSGGLGLLSMNSPDLSTHKFYQNGVLKTTVTTTSTGVASSTNNITAWGKKSPGALPGSSQGNSLSTLGTIIIKRAFTDSEEAALNTIVTAFENGLVR